jgi:VIT1/CCC1 family predicted Fe2+/Mn2+ transporter
MERVRFIKIPPTSSPAISGRQKVKDVRVQLGTVPSGRMKCPEEALNFVQLQVNENDWATPWIETPKATTIIAACVGVAIGVVVNLVCGAMEEALVTSLVTGLFSLFLIIASLRVCAVAYRERH